MSGHKEKEENEDDADSINGVQRDDTTIDARSSGRTAFSVRKHILNRIYVIIIFTTYRCNQSVFISAGLIV